MALKITGGFPCPHCKRLNLCDCDACKKHYSQQELGEYKYRIAEGDSIKCAYCGEIFSYDEALEEEWQEFKKNQVKI